MENENKTKTTAVDLTALLSAFSRAYHLKNSENPVFSDFIAEKMLAHDEYSAVKNYLFKGAKFFLSDEEIKRCGKNEQSILKEIVDYYLSPNPLCRSAWAEKSLKIARLSGVKRYVVLGTGLDTFAFRNSDFLINGEVIEVDKLNVLSDKIARLKAAGLIKDQDCLLGEKTCSPIKNLKYVGVNFGVENLKQRLISAGFDLTASKRGVKTFFSWLGVTYYLEKPQILKTLTEISRLCARGDTLVFDYPSENFFTAAKNRLQKTILMAKAGGNSMKSCFSYSELEKLLYNCGFLIYELLTPYDIQREIIDACGAKLTAFEHVNYCLAVKM